tara:strand:+ start:14078 stop:14521 length:444 start_codon:yes stop_codon:yes gene_type:complete
MLSTALTVFTSSTILFIALFGVVAGERRFQRRFFAAGIRGWFDRVVEAVSGWLFRSWEHFSKYIIQLNWYYSIHGILKAMLKMLVKFYTYFEDLFERNRARTKQLRAEKRQLSEYSHLQQMAEHKKETTLTDAQKERLKKKHLEGKM